MFDCIFHSSLKSRALKDPAFKTFLIGKPRAPSLPIPPYPPSPLWPCRIYPALIVTPRI